MKNIIDFEEERYIKLGKEYKEEKIKLEDDKSWRWAEIKMLEEKLENLKIAYTLDYEEKW